MKEGSVELKCNVKLFADDPSLFMIVQDPNAAASDMNHDLELIRKWAHDWRMSFNPDTRKQAVEVIFSQKNKAVDHPVIVFHNAPVKVVDERKHLGKFIDSKLSFSTSIKEVISKTRRGIGMLIYLSKYLLWYTLTELYKLHVRPHLDYGHVIYQFSYKVILPNGMVRIRLTFCCSTCIRRMKEGGGHHQKERSSSALPVPCPGHVEGDFYGPDRCNGMGNIPVAKFNTFRSLLGSNLVSSHVHSSKRDSFNDGQCNAY